MEKIKKYKGYVYILDNNVVVAGMNPKGKKWGVTRYLDLLNQHNN